MDKEETHLKLWTVVEKIEKVGCTKSMEAKPGPD